MHDVLLAGGTLADGTLADVVVSGGRIAGIGTVGPARSTIDCAGRMILPGFIDTHSHLDGALFEPSAQLAVLRQGVTSVIVGQDGVSYAPGDGRYASDYFAAINGRHPTFRGGSVATLLDNYDRTVPVNVGYLVPQGTVRHTVMGLADRAPSASELAAMVSAVEEGLRGGALGLSTGLDYVPGRLAPTDELIALAVPVAVAGGLYVSHLRGNDAAGVAEAVEIAVRAGVRAHLSHYRAPVADALRWLDEGRAAGADLSFDAYPYDRGSTILAMLVLPQGLQELEVDECIAELGRSAAYFDAEWLLLRGRELGLGDGRGNGWLDRVELTYVADQALAWAEGLSITEAASRQATTPGGFIADVLASSRLQVGATIAIARSTLADARALARDERYMCGSDGIYLGSQPHPRAWGAFARVLADYVRDTGTLTWAEAAWKLSGHPAQRFGLGDRGEVRVGAVADLAVVDPGTVQDRADYGSGRTLAAGVDDVLVAGVAVLRAGELTGATPGVALRRA